MVMEPPRVPLMMMEPPTSLVPGVSACRLSLVLHLLGGANSDKALINCEIAEQLATMVGQLTRVELNLHQMGLTSLVSAPENLANSGGRNALRSKQVAFNQTSFLLILPLDCTAD